MKTLNINNIKCNIGTNARENWELLDAAEEHHLFFHLSKFPSCYVILENENNCEIESIKEAAKVCKANTKYRKLPYVKVDYTFCKNVVKGENVGEIFYKSNKKVNNILV